MHRHQSHPFVDIVPPKDTVSKVVKIIKLNTSKAMKQKFSFLQRVLGMIGERYLVSAVGINEKTTKHAFFGGKIQWTKKEFFI